jgi:subfamily B ATP-binding cassette protein HlyB/CyaB
LTETRPPRILRTVRPDKQNKTKKQKSRAPDGWGLPKGGTPVNAHTPLETDDLVWALASLCNALRVPFEPRLLLQQFPPPASVATLQRAARALGVQLTPCALAWNSLGRNGAPVLALRRDGDRARPAIVLCADSEAALVAERDRAPASVPRAEFAGGYEAQGWVAVAAAPAPQEDGALAQPPFGLGWFVPELLRHGGVWRDVLAASAALQLVALAVPLCTQVVIDKVLVHQVQSTLAAIVTALAIFLLATAVLGYVRQYLLLHTGNRIDAVLGARVFEHLLRLPPRYFERRPTGTLVARLQGVETIREFLTGAATAAALDVPFVVVFLAVMFWYSVPLTLIACGALAALALLSVAVTPLLRRRINQQFLAAARNQAFMTEYVSAMDTVKAMQLEPQLAERYGRNLAGYLHASFATRHLSNGYAVVSGALEQGLAVAILAVGAWYVMQGDGFTIGMLVAFQMFAARLAAPALRLAGIWQEFQQAAIAVQRLGDLMDAPAEHYTVRPVRTARATGRIEFDRVTFRYAPELAPVLEDFSLKVEAGACVALMGPSGSGKSTLARLLLGYYPPSAGAIRVDGHDTRNLSANELRILFGVVPQETRLFSGTIYDNVARAQPHATFAEVIEACRQAEIHEFIEGLPQGYATPIGEHGAGLSGGQKQRIAIARALLRRAPILLFDEATASLDSPTAEALGRTISRLRGRVTILFIAHRLPESLAVDAVSRMGRHGVTRLEPRAAQPHAAQAT